MREGGDKRRLILFAGGGTAGHIVPALPVIAALQQLGFRTGFVVGHAAMEADLLRDSGAEVFTLRTGKLRRYLSIDNLIDVFRTLFALLRCLVLVRRLRPAAVFSKGGYVAVPVVVAAWVWRVPVVAHESDASSGLANRLCFPFLKTLCTSFSATSAPGFKGRIVHTGTPVRAALLDGDAAAGRRLLGLSGDRPLLVVTGGSLGAEGLNRLVREAAPALCERYDMFHVCGAGKAEHLDLAGYRAAEFVADGWGDLLAAADVVVSRAGANALFELLALRKPTLLVPLPALASRGDQIENADWAVQQGLAHQLDETGAVAADLTRAVKALWSDREALTQRLAGYEVPAAVTAIVAEIERVLPKPAQAPGRADLK